MGNLIFFSLSFVLEREWLHSLRHELPWKLGNLIFFVVIWHGKCGISFYLSLFTMRSATFIFIRRDLSLNIGNFISFVEVYVGNWIWKCAGLISSPWFTLGCATFHLVLISVTFLHVSPHLFLWAVLGGPYFHAHGLLPSFTCPIYRYFTILRKPRGNVNIDQYWYNNLALFWLYLRSLLKISVIFCLMFTQHLISFVFVYLLSKYRLPLVSCLHNKVLSNFTPPSNILKSESKGNLREERKSAKYFNSFLQNG